MQNHDITESELYQTLLNCHGNSCLWFLDEILLSWSGVITPVINSITCILHVLYVIQMDANNKADLFNN